MSQELSNLQALINQLCSNGSETTPTWSNVLNTAATLSERLSHSFGLDWNQLDQLSVQLWNKTVVLKTKGTFDNVTVTKLRQIAFQMVSAINDSSNDEVGLKKQLKMGIKVARSWLDVKEVLRAEKALSVLNQTVQRLQHLVIERGNRTQNASVACRDKREVESNMLYIYSLTAELEFMKDQKETAYSIFCKAQDMLPNLPEQAPYLSSICYGFGVDSFLATSHNQAIIWLRNSYNLGKEGPYTVSNEVQARTLRLLANCYLESKEDGWQENAFNAISLANTEHPHPSGLYISVHLHLIAQGMEEDIKNALKLILDHTDCDVDLCCNTLQLLKTFHRLQPAFDLRHSFIQKFQMSEKLGLFFTAMLDLLLTEGASDLSMAKTFADECVSAHMSGQRLDQVTRKQFHILFWNKAAYFFQMDKFEEAVLWYNFSLTLYPPAAQGESDLAKLHRNIAACNLKMGRLDGAFEFIEKAEMCDPSCPQTHFTAYKIALNANNADRAMSSLQKLIDCVSRNQVGQEGNVICMAAYMAMEKEKTDLALPALECIINCGRCEKRAFTALKCLLRLKVSQVEDKRADVKSMLVNIRTAYNRLLVMQGNGSLESAQLQEEASWFMKIGMADADRKTRAWNLALKTEKDPAAMKEFFVLCSQLLSLCATDVNNHNKYQTCLVMANAACLQMARQEVDKGLQMNLLEEVLQHLEEYKLADNQAQNSFWAQGPLKASTSSDILMMMYEFEALTKLNSPRAEGVLERALTLPKPDPDIFHTLAALASDPPSHNPTLAMRALKVAIRLHLQGGNPDFGKCSMDVRNLIELCMDSNETEALSYFKETLDMIDKRAKDAYPDIELLWLMTKSWNRGLQYFNCNKFSSAEQWCSLSMKMLKYLPSTRADYEDQSSCLMVEVEFSEHFHTLEEYDHLLAYDSSRFSDIKMMTLYGELMSYLEREGKKTSAEE